MIDVNKLRNGTAFEWEDEPHMVLNYEFTKMGRGNGTVKVKVRNLKTMSLVTMGFTTGAKVQEIELKRKPMQFLYADSDNCVFMDPESYEQVEINNELVEDVKAYFQDGMEVKVLFWEDRALSVELPPKLVFIVKEADPGEKGNSAANIYKSAVLENGLQVKVPLFVNTGEKIVVDTRTGEYIERAR